MIHIYTGNAKGKTTCAIGLAVRARGQGLKVAIFQFLKPKAIQSGEEKLLKKIKGIELVKFDQMHPMFHSGDVNFLKLKEGIEKDFKKIEKTVLSKKYDMVILDEVINAVDQNFIDIEKFIKLLKKAPKDVEIVLTGRGDISNLELFADYITVMVEKKHPFRKQKLARKGIEY
ncbi:MAG: cob(I)yrinic acid a,c-diamide adenosyltransferase [Candidatus Omnitrophota bacterium]